MRKIGKPRKWWIKNGIAYEREPDDQSLSFPVVEYVAYDQLLTRFEAAKRRLEDHGLASRDL